MSGGSAAGAAFGLPAAFALGSIPFGLLVARVFFATDIRASGSGNIGAANALRTLGAKAGAAVLALDALKGVLAVALAGGAWLSASLALAPLAGLAAVLGHCYTPWLRLRGGKGVATFLGAASVLSWQSGVAFGIVWCAVVAVSGFSSLGSLAATLAAAGVLLATGSRYGAGAAVFAFGSLAVIAWKHRENLGRLRAGTENRLTLLKR